MAANFEPTIAQRKQVEALVSFGIVELEIAAYLGIGMKRLRKYFKEELKRGGVAANAAVCNALFKRATVDKDTTAIIWWTKCRMGWREQPKDATAAVNVQILNSAQSHGLTEADVQRLIQSEIEWRALPEEKRLRIAAAARAAEEEK